MNTDVSQFFATCPKGIENLLFNELTELGASNVRETVAGVYFDADLETAYKVCLWTRYASRILKPIEKVDVLDPDQIYRTSRAIPWGRYFEGDKTFVVDFIGTNEFIRHSQFGAQRIKDGIVDHFEHMFGLRPSVDKRQPDIHINVRLAKNIAYFSFDFSGESLHRRGYREVQGAAPLKENLAAAILGRANWPILGNKTNPTETAEKSKQASVLIDPMCGSGTFLIEGAYIALGIAPGVDRKAFGFENLKSFDAQTWLKLRDQAREIKATAIKESDFRFYGYDQDSKVVALAKKNIQQAGLSHLIQVDVRRLANFSLPSNLDSNTQGLCICNPPYGERLGEVEALRQDYRLLGQVAKTHLSGWQLAVFTGNEQLGKELRLRSKKQNRFYNGTIASQLIVFDIVGGEKKLREDRDMFNLDAELTDGAKMVFNRLAKNQKRLAKWVKQNSIESYRVYDADIPEYAVAVDIYADYVHLQEYQAPKSVDENKAAKRFNEAKQAVIQFFKLSEDRLSVKVRRRNKGSSQYERQSFAESDKLVVRENQSSVYVNLFDYLDTGLFLDHRPLRKRIAQQSKGKSFLNLFCYTATATVQAINGGATSSVSVDLSNTYIDWARDNFKLNKIDSPWHKLVREDCFKWLENCRQGFDIIMLDPPSFSNSKKMDSVLDVQRDHVKLITRCMEILNPEGVLYFSTNLRSFKLESELVEKYQVENISSQTLDPDFEKNPKIHFCWSIKN